MTSFILARHDEAIERCEQRVSRCQSDLACAPKEDEERLKSIWRQAEGLQLWADHMQRAYRNSRGVATEAQAQRIEQTRESYEYEQLKWRNMTGQLNAVGRNVYSINGSSINPRFSAVADAQDQLGKAQAELIRAHELKFASRYRQLAAGVIVEASADHLIVELAVGGYCRVEPVGADGCVTTLRGELPLLGAGFSEREIANPFEGLVGLQIIEADAHQYEGQMRPQLRIADHLETGYIEPAASAEDDDQSLPGSFAVTECEWEPVIIAAAPSYRIYEVAKGRRDQLVDEGYYARRVNGELQILYTSGWMSYSDSEGVSVEYRWRDSVSSQYGDRGEVKAADLGEKIDVEAMQGKQPSSGIELLMILQGERALESLSRRIYSAGRGFEEEDWGLPNHCPSLADAEDGEIRYLFRDVRSMVMRTFGITHLDRNWRWM